MISGPYRALERSRILRPIRPEGMEFGQNLLTFQHPIRPTPQSIPPDNPDGKHAPEELDEDRTAYILPNGDNECCR